MQRRRATRLLEYLDPAAPTRPTLWAGDNGVVLSELANGSALGAPLDTLRGCSVLVLTSDQLTAALTMLELDGLARRLVLCPPDFDHAHLPYVIATAEVDAIVTDMEPAAFDGLDVEHVVSCDRSIHPMATERASPHDTEWILFTSGTTGVPKMVVHSLATLTGAIDPARNRGAVWATFYDIRRYGGLQIFLRVVLGGGSLVLSARDETAASFLLRAREHAVTHITGTPSHWRRALMSTAAQSLSPVYARLSGEIVDQAILDRLRFAFPEAQVAHAFASTEGGVAFDVTDGRAGFPALFLEPNDQAVDLAVADDTLRIRSSRTALHYLGDGTDSLHDEDGFIDTGDVVERRDDRYYFIGRRGGIINVGGLKIHPEEVEAVINRHPAVRMSLVTSRRNPITGAIVAAEVVLAPNAERSLDVATAETTKGEILEACRSALAAHKVPATIRFVPSLTVTPSGKLERKRG